MAEVDPTVPIADIATYDQIVHRGLASERFSFALVGVFAASALLLAVSSGSAIIAYQTARRRKEFGIRIAVGAGTEAIARLILAETARFTVPGLVAGTLLTALGSRFLASQLFAVPASDAGTYALGVGVLGALAVAASLVPMLRMTRLDPTQVLREE